MSNLKFAVQPNFVKLLNDEFLFKSGSRKIAHNTYVERYDYEQPVRLENYEQDFKLTKLVIRYHGNPIAKLDVFDNPVNFGRIGRLVVSDCGWNTPTTRNRLNIIFRANFIGASATQRKNNPELNYTDPYDESFNSRDVWSAERHGYYVIRRAVFVANSFTSKPLWHVGWFHGDTPVMVVN